MEGIIPKHESKGVDFCGSSYYYYIIRSDLGCYMKAKDFNKGSDLSVHALHPSCQNGDHYIADENGRFYIIKGDKYRRVTDLTEDTDSAVFTLHPNCRGGDHYLSAFGWFYIIFQGKDTYRRTADLSKDSDPEEFPLHPNCRDGLYYWGLPDHYYFLKPVSKWGVQYYKGTNFNKDECTAVYSVHPDVLNFLPGGLSITSGPAFSKWVKIETFSNDSPTPVTWQDTITKRVGYNNNKMTQITYNWTIAASLSISAEALAGLIANAQFTLLGVYERSSVKIEKENWTEVNKVEEQLSCELKPHERLYVWQYQLGLGSEPVLFCKDLKITVTALIMEAANLCDSLFPWLENRKKCAEELEKLAKELEDVHQGSSTGTSVDVIYARAAFISVIKDLASDSTAEKKGVSTFDKATKLIKEDEKVGTSIQKLLRDLKVRCGETLKDRCGEASLGDHADELDCEVTTLLMSALARSHRSPGGLAAVEASDFICQALRLDRFPEITSGLKVSAKVMMKNIGRIGIKTVAKCVIGLGIFPYDPLVKSEELANRSGIPEASKFLRDSARQILDSQQKLKKQLDAMQEIIQKLFITKILIKDLGGYSLFIDENAQNIMDYIRGTCTDTVLSWLKGLTHQIQFVNLLRFFKERLSPIPDDLSKPSGGHIHIVFVAHGGIVDQFMPAGGLVPTPNITDTILYSPWNCSIDSNTAFAIAQGTIKPADRAFFNIAHCQPIPLPDHWNSMRRSQESRHDIPEILLYPVTRKDGAWIQFQELWQNRRLEIEDRVLIPYLVPQDQVNAFGEIPLYIFIFLTSFLLKAFDKSATVHLAACLSRVQRVTQYAYTRDGMCMTVKIHDKDMKSELYRALRSLFDTNRR